MHAAQSALVEVCMLTQGSRQAAHSPSDCPSCPAESIVVLRCQRPSPPWAGPIQDSSAWLCAGHSRQGHRAPQEAPGDRRGPQGRQGPRQGGLPGPPRPRPPGPPPTGQPAAPPSGRRPGLQLSSYARLSTGRLGMHAHSLDALETCQAACDP